MILYEVSMQIKRGNQGIIQSKLNCHYLWKTSDKNDIIKEYQRHVNANALASIYLIFRHLKKN